MATLTNEQREDATVVAALVADPISPPSKAYDELVTPYPIWAKMHKCGVTRSSDKH